MNTIKVIILSSAIFLIGNTVYSQENSAKQKADSLAKKEFSKNKHKRKEKNGVVIETHVEIVSTPVVKNSLSFYEGNYVNKDLDYKLEIRTTADQRLMATLTIGDAAPVVLRNVSLKDAYFTAVRTTNNTTETWEGVFIDRNDGNATEFGLGIKLPNPIMVTDQGLTMSRLFFKKVSP
jgi:hypothetical protein